MQAEPLAKAWTARYRSRTDPRMSLELTIVIPAYNESGRLPATLQQIAQMRTELPLRLREVLVVDDGSRDQTAAVASQAPAGLPVRVIRYSENAGKGYAIRRGAMEAEGDLILISDADLSTPLTELPKMLSGLELGAVVIGSRAIDRLLVKVRQAPYREWMGRGFNFLLRSITGIPFRDTQCGFKLMSRATARQIFPECIVDGFAWDVEVILRAGRMGHAVVEVPVLWFNAEQSRVNVLTDPLLMIRDTVRLRLQLGRFPHSCAIVWSGKASPPHS